MVENFEMRDLAIFGAGGHARVAADTALSTGRWPRVLLFDDTWPSSQYTGSFPLAGDKKLLTSNISNYEIFIGIGDNARRMELFNEFKRLGAAFATIIHPAAYISPYASVGEGTIVMPACVVNYGAKIGECCILNSNSTIEHDCFLSDGIHISPGVTLGGGVTVGTNSWVGLGASVRQAIVIGAFAVVGAGSTVIRNVKDNTTVIGTPASPKRS